MPAFMDDRLFLEGRPAFWALDGTRVNTGLPGRCLVSRRRAAQPGVTLQQAQTEMTAMALRIGPAIPKTKQPARTQGGPLPDGFDGRLRAPLTWLVMALCGMVLLIACVIWRISNSCALPDLTGIDCPPRAPGCPRPTLIRCFVTDASLFCPSGGKHAMIPHLEQCLRCGVFLTTTCPGIFA